MIAKNLSVGILFGFALSRSGFHDFNEIHNMFALIDLRMLFIFALSVAVLTLKCRLRGDRTAKPNKFHMGIVLGSTLFGVGWAVTGACPSVVLLQIAHGKLPALITFLGIIVGMLSYRKINKRFFGWKIASCGDI